MSRIPRPSPAAVAEPENEPIADSTNHKRTVDQAWSPPPPPLAPVDTNLKKKRIETNAASGDVRPPEQQKQQRIDSQQVPLDEVALWEATKAETGWDVTDCLEHKVGNARIGPVSISPSHPLTLSLPPPPSLPRKLSLPKKDDAQKKVATLGQHVKRLRALGWSLYGQRNDAEASLRSAGQKVEAMEAELESVKASLDATSASLDAEVTASKLAIAEKTSELADLAAKLEEVDKKLKETDEERAKLEDELEAYHLDKAGLEQKLQAAETAQTEQQKYSMTLQEYNSKLQKEVQGMNEQLDELRRDKAKLVEDKASLTGRVQALGDALEALQASSTKNEEARKDAVEELASLRGELASLSAERCVVL